MSRFTFSQRLGPTPSEGSYNGIAEDFKKYINSTKLSQDNISDESIRFRHLKRSPVIMIFKDCGNAVWNSAAPAELGRAGAWDLYRDTNAEADNTLEVTYAHSTDAPGGDLVEFTTWYYPYSMSARSEVVPAVYRDSAWVPLIEHRRPAGIGVGFYGKLEQPMYNPTGLSRHPFLQFGITYNTGVGSYDRPGTASLGGPVICTITMKRKDLVGVTKFGMMIKMDTSQDQTPAPSGLAYRDSRWSKYDRLYLSLVVRDN